VFCLFSHSFCPLKRPFKGPLFPFCFS
jgi:hypothetical protein